MTIQINDLNTSDFQELTKEELQAITGGFIFASSPWHRSNRRIGFAG